MRSLLLAIVVFQPLRDSVDEARTAVDIPKGVLDSTVP
jgi:hypothetical protein